MAASFQDGCYYVTQNKRSRKLSDHRYCIKLKGNIHHSFKCCGQALLVCNFLFTYPQNRGQTCQSQKSFTDKVQKLFSVMEDLGNPFQEEFKDLLTLNIRSAHIEHKTLHIPVLLSW